MQQIDRLIVKATQLKPTYDDIFIISNVSGGWMVGEHRFPGVEAAQQYIDELTAGREVSVIINDTGPSLKKEVSGRVRNPIKNPDANRSAADTHPSNEYGYQRKNRPQNSQYRHTWV